MTFSWWLSPASSGLSLSVSSVTGDLVMSFLPHCVARTGHEDAPLPCSVRMRSLRVFAGDLGEGSLLCLVRTLRAYLDQSTSAAARSSTLFVSPHSPRMISENTVSSFLRDFFRVLGLSGKMRVLPCALTAFEGFPTLLCFCKTGRFLRCWRLQLRIKFSFCFFLFS